MVLTRGRVRHLKVRVEDQLASDIEAFARNRNLSISDAVRLLAREQLAVEASSLGNAAALVATGLATLMAAEQALQLLEQFLPDGKRRSLQLAAAAADAARDRLEQVEHLLALGDGQ